MLRFFSAHWFSVGFAGVLIFTALYLLWGAVTRDPLEGFTTTTVERGDVEDVVSVSGITRARSTAQLAFPTPGIVSKVYVKEGDTVREGDVLATIGAEGLVAQRASALAALRLAEADRDELLAGKRAEARAVTDTTVAIAKADLARTTDAQDLAVENARRTLYSDDLAARSEKSSEDAVAPIISGTYRCDESGQYRLEVFSSNNASGYSFRLSGLETGTYSASILQPTPFGSCGLFALFDTNSNYSSSVWSIEVPNLNASSYVTNKNAYDKSIIDRANAISSAEQSLALARSKQVLENADPLREALTRVEAKVEQAASRVAEIDALLGDKAIVAPFNGSVTLADILPGETAGSAPVFTVLADDAFELVARIPEIDITKISNEQSARIIFDARRDVTLPGLVTYISPLPVQIDGVAYFEVKLALEKTPEWLRGGLNADIDIVIAKASNVLRIPKRYLENVSGTDTVRTLSGTAISNVPVTTTFIGNDGFVAVEGVLEGALVIAP